jgi:hypothetical protein
MRSVTSRRSSIGVDVPPVTPTIFAFANGAGSQVGDILDLDRGGPGDLAQPGQLLGVGARAPTDDDHQVDLTAASRVSCWRRIVTGQTVLTILSSWARETMNAAAARTSTAAAVDWLRSAPSACARDRRLPLLFLVDDDRVGANPRRPTTSGCFGVPSRTIV